MTVRSWLRPAIPAFAAALLAATAFTPARAAPPPVSADQAKVVEGDLRAWLGGLVGAIVDVKDLPLKVTAEADSYELSVPFGGAIADGAVNLGDGAITVRVKPLDDHRWSVESFRLPSPWTIHVDKKLTEASKNGISGMMVKIGDQDTHGVIDTSLATTSTLDTRVKGYVVTMDTKEGPQHTRVDGVTSHVVWQPGAAGLVDVSGQSEVTGYQASSVLPTGKKLAIGIGKMAASLSAKGVAAADLGAMLHGASSLIASAKAAGEAGKPKPDGIPDADKPTVKALVKALGGMMGSLTTDTSYENLTVDVGGMGGSLHKLAIGFDMAAPGGHAQLAWRIMLQGLDSPMIPPGVYRDYLPHELRLTPHVGGIDKHALEALLQRVIDDPNAADDFMTVSAELLAKGPLELGVRDIAFDLGPAKLVGGGGVRIVSMADYTGAGEFRVTGLDELIQRANATPELKPAVAGLIFIKGIGKQEGKTTVWKIRYADHKLMVNDNDMTAMLGGK